MSRGTRGLRGGLGVRKAAAELMERSTKYQLSGVRAGTLVVEMIHLIKKWDGPTRRGVITRNSGSAVFVHWAGDPEPTYYTGGDARFNVDMDRWRLGEVQPLAFRALTREHDAPKVISMPHDGAPILTEEKRDMAKTEAELKKLTAVTLKAMAAEYYDEDELKGAKKADLVNMVLNAQELESNDVDEELDDEPMDPDLEAELEDQTKPEDDELDDDEVDDTPAKKPSTPEPSGDQYSAKQIATRINTDPKVLRKFFRSEASTVEPVGLGGRYMFAKEDLDKIKQEFEAWSAGNKSRGTKRASRKTEDAPKRETQQVEELDDELELEDEEPTVDDLEDLELDDDDELEDDELDDDEKDD